MSNSKRSIPKVITTVEDVADFARYLALDLHINFHPDNPFSDYLDDAALVLRLDNLMKQCFNICEREGVDIYGVMGWPDEKPYDKIGQTEGVNPNYTRDCIVMKS